LVHFGDDLLTVLVERSQLRELFMKGFGFAVFLRFALTL
jgi:hypothetical protein